MAPVSIFVKPPIKASMNGFWPVRVAEFKSLAPPMAGHLIIRRHAVPTRKNVASKRTRRVLFQLWIGFLPNAMVRTFQIEIFKLKFFKKLLQIYSEILIIVAICKKKNAVTFPVLVDICAFHNETSHNGTSHNKTYNNGHNYLKRTISLEDTSAVTIFF